MSDDDYNEHYSLDPKSKICRHRNVATAIAVTRMVREKIQSWLVGLDDDDEVPEIDRSDMTGACGMVSWVSHRVMTRLGYVTHLVRGEFEEGVHCWLQLGHIIVDGTATQFGIPGPVYVTTKGRDDRYEELFRDDDTLEEFLRDWRTQSPYRFGRELTDIEDRVFKHYRRRHG